MSVSLKNTVKALLNVEAMFMTDLYCQLVNALCFVYLSLRNQQFAKYHQDIFRKIVIPSDGSCIKKKKKRNMILYLFSTMPWKLYLLPSSQHIESKLLLSPICQSDHGKFQENVLVMSIRAIRLISQMVKLHLPPPLSRRLAFTSLQKNNVSRILSLQRSKVSLFLKPC